MQFMIWQILIWKLITALYPIINFNQISNFCLNQQEPQCVINSSYHTDSKYCDT